MNTNEKQLSANELRGISINTPYVKKNPNDILVESYFNPGPNRKARRQKPPRFMNNRGGSGCNLVRTPMGAYKKIIQWETDKDGDLTPRMHYILIDKSKTRKYAN